MHKKVWSGLLVLLIVLTLLPLFSLIVFHIQINPAFLCWGYILMSVILACNLASYVTFSIQKGSLVRYSNLVYIPVNMLFLVFSFGIACFLAIAF